MNIGKWILRNLFNEFIREEVKSANSSSSQSGTAPPSSFKHPKALSENAAESRSPESNAQDLTSKPSRSTIPKMHPLSPIAQSPAASGGSGDAPTPRPATRSTGTPAVVDNSSTSSNSGSASTSTTAPTTGAAPAASASTRDSQDYFSYPTRRRPTTAQSASGQTAGQTTPDDFSGWGGPGSVKQGAQEGDLAAPSTPGGRLMGRLKSFGKSTRRAATEVETPSANPASSDLSEGESGVRVTSL